MINFAEQSTNQRQSYKKIKKLKLPKELRKELEFRRNKTAVLY